MIERSKMDYKEQKVSRSQAQIMLERFKAMEAETKFHQKRINDKTIVYCKNKERLDDYTQQCKTI